jgi:hypothetical protein
MVFIIISSLLLAIATFLLLGMVAITLDGESAFLSLAGIILWGGSILLLVSSIRRRKGYGIKKLTLSSIALIIVGIATFPLVGIMENSESDVSVALSNLADSRERVTLSGFNLAFSELRLAVVQSSLYGSGTFSRKQFDVLGEMVKKVDNEN